MHEADPMLSMEMCRRLLPPGVKLSDTDLEAIRDALYAVAEVAVDQVISKGIPARAVEGDALVTHDDDPKLPEFVSITEVSESTEVDLNSSSKEEPLDAGKEE